MGGTEPTKDRPPWLRRIVAARHARPFTLTFISILPIPAVIAIIVGDRASAALTNLGAGVYSRLIGIVLLLGCAITYHAIISNRSLNEALGMVLVAMGSYLYGFGVILGLLPFGGIIAGCGFLGIGTGFLMSMFTLTTLARYNITRDDDTLSTNERDRR